MTVHRLRDEAGPASDLSAGAAFVDGVIVPVGEARIQLLDWGFLRSDACQDTVSVWKGAFFCLDRHLARFRRSLEGLRLSCSYDDAALSGILASLVRSSGLSQGAYVQMLVTRGRPAPGSRDPRSCTNRFYAFCLPYVRVAPSDGAGLLELAISRRPRISAAAVPSEIKNYHWIDFELALFEAYERGATSVVLSDAAGTLTEGPGFNLFCVADGVLHTPGANVLPGITRQIVFELAAELGLRVKSGSLFAEDLLSADEAFATSTAGGLMPVQAVDGKPLKAAPGPITALVRDTYWEKREAGWHGTPVASL